MVYDSDAHLAGSRILFPIRTAERVVELIEDGSGVMERNAVSGQLTLFSVLHILKSAADSATCVCANRPYPRLVQRLLTIVQTGHEKTSAAGSEAWQAKRQLKRPIL